MLDVRRLTLLREVETRGSIAAVSRALGISSSAISQQIAKLESEVGLTLLEQVGRTVQLTPAAQLLSRRVDDVVTILEDAESEIESRRSRVQGVVRFAAFSTYAVRYLPEVLHRMAQTHPDVVVEFTLMEPPEGLEAVAGRRVDLAVADEFPRIPRRVDRTMTRTHLVRDRMVPYLPRAATSLDEAAAMPWVLEPSGSDACLWAQRVCREAGFEPIVQFDSPDLRLHHELARSGIAAAFVPQLVLGSGPATLPEPPHRFSWPAASAEDLYRDVYAVRRRGTDARPAVAALLQHLEEVAAEG